MGIPLLITLILTPLVVICCYSIYIVRGFIILLSKIFRRDLSEILESQSTFFAVMDVYTKPGANCLVTLIVEGGTTEELCIERIEHLLKEKSEGKLKYGRLQEYLTPWMGFLFWTKEKNFRVKDHFKIIMKGEDGKVEEGRQAINNSKEIGNKEMKEIQKELIRKPYCPERSAWELVLIKNVKLDYAMNGMKYDAVVFKIHHSLGDGFSLLKMFGGGDTAKGKSIEDKLKEVKVEKLSYNGEIEKSEDLEQKPIIRNHGEIKCAKNGLEGNFIKKMFLDIYTSIRTPFDLIYQILFVKPDENDFHLESDELCGTEKFHLVETDKIPVDSIKRIKNHFGVNFIAVVLAAVTAGIRSSMQKKGVIVPTGLKIAVLSPFPGHPDKMTNHWTMMIAEFPVGLSNSEERLKYLDNQITAFKSGIEPIISFKSIPWIGALFYWMVKPFAPLIHPTGLLSDFPGPIEEISDLGGKVSDISFNLGFPPGRVGLMFTSLSYNGYWKMNLAVDHAILSEDGEAQDFADAIAAEINKLIEQSCV